MRPLRLSIIGAAIVVAFHHHHAHAQQPSVQPLPAGALSAPGPKQEDFDAAVNALQAQRNFQADQVVNLLVRVAELQREIAALKAEIAKKDASVDPKLPSVPQYNTPGAK